MNKEDAIIILKKQKNKLTTLKWGDMDLWLVQTEYYIGSFFNDYSIHKQVMKEAFRPDITQSNYDGQKDVFKTRMDAFLANCIEIIEDVDIRNPEGKNYLYKLNDTWLTASIIFATTFIFAAGAWYGRYHDNRQYEIQINGDFDKVKKSMPVLLIDSFHGPNKQTNTSIKNK